MTKFVQDFDVSEKSIEELHEEFQNVTIVHKYVCDLSSADKVIPFNIVDCVLNFKTFRLFAVVTERCINIKSFVYAPEAHQKYFILLY